MEIPETDLVRVLGSLVFIGDANSVYVFDAKGITASSK
jgi:hypothetical protein